MMQPLTPVIKNLIIVNVIFFVLIYSLKLMGNGWEDFFPLYNLNTFGGDAITSFRPYQIVTTMFTHFGPSHLFFNMLGLYFFGPLVEKTIGAKKTLIAYLAGGAFSATVFMVFYTYVINNPGFALLGASGALYTILVIAAMYYPKMTVQMIFPPIKLKMGLLIAIFIGIDLYSFFTGARPGIAHLAHLGGAAMGFILYYIWNKR